MKEKTDEPCPKCSNKLDKEFWGRSDKMVDYAHSCSKCGYWQIIKEERENGKTNKNDKRFLQES